MTAKKNKNLKRIGLLLSTIVILPVLLYTANEINTMDDTERMVKDIYERQMDALLFSVNQHSWDYLNEQISKAKELLKNKTFDKKAYFTDTNPITMINVYDMDLNLLQSEHENTHDGLPHLFKTRFPEYLNKNYGIIKNLIKNDSLGYQKIHTLSEEDFPVLKNDFFISLFVIPDVHEKTPIVALLVNISRFLNNVIQPKLLEISDDRFEVNIFSGKKISEKYSFSNLQYADVAVDKKLWIFPNLSVGMRSLGQDITELTQKRFNQSLILIVVLLIGLLTGATIIYRNIQKEIRLSELKADFVSNVSHELRTPLSLIRMYAETLELGRIKDEPKKIEYYKNISYESERLTHLINNILNFSRIESGKKTYDLQPVSLNKTVNRIIDTYREHIHSSNFELNVEMNGEELTIDADEASISEAIINLLDNAVKYSEDNKKIEVKTGSENGHAFVSVKDFGIGIKPQNRNKIFEKFYRESSALVHNTKGSGLGLSLVKYIMDAHQGYVGLESSPGNGSCFTLYFPNHKTEGDEI